MPFVVLIVDRGISLLVLVIVVTSLLSWVSPDPRNPVVKLLHAIVDPILHPIRVVLPSVAGMDFSPLVAILVLSGLQKLIMSALYQ